MTTASPCALCSEAEAAGARSRAPGRGFQSGKGTNGRAAWTVSLSGHCALRSCRGVQTRAFEKCWRRQDPRLQLVWRAGPLPLRLRSACLTRPCPAGWGRGSLYHPLFRTLRGHEVPAARRDEQ